MADSSSLLFQSNSDESGTSLLEKKVRSLDDTIEQCIGRFGWAQFFQAVLVSFAWAFDAQQAFISVFTDAEPTWHCIDDSCNSAADLCILPKSAWAWDNPARTSIISEWNLVCAGPIVKGLPTSSLFMGCLVGGLVLATLADSSLGRKNLLVLSCLMMSLTGVLTVFSTNVWVYSALRFVTGFGRASISSCALVLATETVGNRWRGEVGIIGFFCFTLGFLSLPAMAYLSRGFSWRILYLCTSIPAICYSCLLHLAGHESPRWLFLQGRKEEAIKTLKRMASPYYQSFSFSTLPIQPEKMDVNLYSAIKILWEKTWTFQRLSVLTIMGFGIGMGYYGMPLSVGNLAFSLYFSVTLNGLSELPASLITFFLIGRLNRKISLLVFTIISGVCSIICVVLDNGHKGLQIGMEIVSFFSVCTACNVLLIYTLELFPTCVRNSSMSMVRLSIMLGAVISPILVAAGRKDVFFSYGIFGLVIGCCGLLVVFLPETRGGTLCDTIDEQEQKEIKASTVDDGVGVKLLV